MTAGLTDIFVLIHSPLVGPLTWSLVAGGLRRRGLEVVVPVLDDDDGSGIPYWRQHIASAAAAVASLPEDRALVLVGHSGAGPLLPAVGESCCRHVGAYLFVDAALPLDGQSRLDDMEADDPEFARQPRQHLASAVAWQIVMSLRDAPTNENPRFTQQRTTTAVGCGPPRQGPWSRFDTAVSVCCHATAVAGRIPLRN